MAIRITTETKYRAVARYLAMGIDLRVICENLGLSVQRWQVIVGEPIFKDILRVVQESMEDKLADEVGNDPILIQMKMAGGAAVKRMVAEIDNLDPNEGASSVSRLKAAEGILSRIGYYKKDTPAGAAHVTIEISDRKAAIINNTAIPTEAADNVKL